MNIHCTNESCHKRKDCKKGLPMRDGQQAKYFCALTQFHDCEHFECRKCSYKYVHGTSEKQCEICGNMENHYLWEYESCRR